MRLDMLASWRPSPLLPSLLPRHCDADGLFGRDAMIHALGGLGDGQLHPFDCSGEGFATYVPDMRRSMPPGSGSDRAANAASAHVLDVLVVRERQGQRQREGLTSLCKVAALQPAVRGKKIEAGFLRLGVSGAPRTPWDRFVADSALEGDGFELLVPPRRKLPSRAPCGRIYFGVG